MLWVLSLHQKHLPTMPTEHHWYSWWSTNGLLLWLLEGLKHIHFVRFLLGSDSRIQEDSNDMKRLPIADLLYFFRMSCSFLTILICLGAIKLPSRRRNVQVSSGIKWDMDIGNFKALVMFSLQRDYTMPA